MFIVSRSLTTAPITTKGFLSVFTEAEMGSIVTETSLAVPTVMDQPTVTVTRLLSFPVE